LVTGPEGPHNPANAAYKQRLLTLRNEMNLHGAAHFLAEVDSDFLPDEVIADFYRLADALFMPSREEGFGIPILEAGFSHIPVFCADIPVLRELGGEDVTYFDPDADPVLVAELVAHKMEAESTSKWARRARQGYAWTQIYTLQIDPLIKEVCQ
jgi:glycosyltransferase involved in cell wall biosynthesis